MDDVANHSFLNISILCGLNFARATGKHTKKSYTIGPTRKRSAKNAERERENTTSTLIHSRTSKHEDTTRATTQQHDGGDNENNFEAEGSTPMWPSGMNRKQKAYVNAPSCHNVNAGTIAQASLHNQGVWTKLHL